MFAINPDRCGWKSTSEIVRGLQQSQSGDGPSEIQVIPAPELDPLAPRLKLALPQIFPDKRLASGYFTNGARLKQVSQAAYEAVTRATQTRIRNSAAHQLPHVHVDLTGEQPTVPLTINAEKDLVYLHHPVSGPGVWGAMRRIHRRWPVPGDDEDDDEVSLRIASNPDQSKNIQHILLPFHADEYRRICVGCHKLEHHYEQMRHLARNRVRDRDDRARGAGRWAGRPGVKPACKMCRRVQQQLQASGEDADEAAVRERLLRERMLAMLPEVRLDCEAADYHLDVILAAYPAPGTENDDDDTVSICSADIDADDDFGWYNNSRELLVVDTIPFPKHGHSGAAVPAWYLDLPGPSVPSSGEESSLSPSHESTSLDEEPSPSEESSSQVEPSAPPSSPPSPPPTHFHPDSSNDTPTPKHLTHPQCTQSFILSLSAPQLPFYFKQAQSLHLVDYDLTLRPDITTLPSEGRRWYSGSGGVFVEVLDVADGRWVSERDVLDGDSGLEGGWADAVGDGEGEDVDGEGEGAEDLEEVEELEEGEIVEEKKKEKKELDPVGVVEYVRWLRAWWGDLLSAERNEGVARKIEVGVVAYLALDEAGRVSFEERARKRVWGGE
ncbi:hypothetical protein C8A01DRAFT_31992 [Parachaetomium inaequale]|uniref:Uncharacterized protein n=1 Tax=Parachaetomium inaequale TaxID=2588326 RepID=A0AAN6SUS4_9PEZI|nr:hypothetical protein C8A01DRAFT_31992 [Parachaetomium inaequale]